jgi:hypothetical protein
MKLRLTFYVVFSLIGGYGLFMFLTQLSPTQTATKQIVSSNGHRPLTCKVLDREIEERRILLKNKNIICDKGGKYQTFNYIDLTDAQKQDVKAFGMHFD